MAVLMYIRNSELGIREREAAEGGKIREEGKDARRKRKNDKQITAASFPCLIFLFTRE
jgi:hypothetical protein